jgi:hypothetical protein
MNIISVLKWLVMGSWLLFGLLALFKIMPAFSENIVTFLLCLLFIENIAKKCDKGYIYKEKA